jgi:fructokinase
MGQVFANVVNTLDPEVIILGGGLSNIPIWYEKVPDIMKRSFFGPPREVPILKAQMGDSSGVLGAAYLALRELGEMKF